MEYYYYFIQMIIWFVEINFKQLISCYLITERILVRL